MCLAVDSSVRVRAVRHCMSQSEVGCVPVLVASVRVTVRAVRHSMSQSEVGCVPVLVTSVKSDSACCSALYVTVRSGPCPCACDVC